MEFTALHRLLGQPPGPITDGMLSAAVDQRVEETSDLDWKREVPPSKSLPLSDYPKDVAAMANSGGGVIVYGVAEESKAAVARVDVGEVSEAHERSLRAAAITAISPPVFGLGIYRLGASGSRALAVTVPGTVEGPHLIYRNEYFGAPIRNDADTVWMREQQIEAMYWARFEDRRNTAEALNSLYSEIAAGRAITERAWMIGVARPRVLGQVRERVSREDARRMLRLAQSISLGYSNKRGPHPFEDVDVDNSRPGLRRRVAPPRDPSERSRWKEAWASVHDDGSVAFAAAIGGHRASSGDFAPGSRLLSARMERFVASLMGLLKITSERLGTHDYDLKIGVEWDGNEPLILETVDNNGYPFDGTSIPLPHYAPVTASIRTDVAEGEFLQQVRDLATDVVNQGGIAYLHAIHPE